MHSGTEILRLHIKISNKRYHYTNHIYVGSDWESGPGFEKMGFDLKMPWLLGSHSGLKRIWNTSVFLQDVQKLELISCFLLHLSKKFHSIFRSFDLWKKTPNQLFPAIRKRDIFIHLRFVPTSSTSTAHTDTYRRQRGPH